MADNKKAEGILRGIFISTILFSMGFLALFALYSDITTNYDYLNISESPGINISSKINETFKNAEDNAVTRVRGLQERSGTADTGEGATILSSFFGVLEYIKNSFNLLYDLIPDVASALKIPDYWWKGFIAIISITIFVLVIAGFLRTSSQW